uniref:Uncharacterized protein n=1 Tax=Eutreptiella gymnastica TaxID=73025 RepID=A0A7S1JGW5_9EUGL
MWAVLHTKAATMNGSALYNQLPDTGGFEQRPAAHTEQNRSTQAHHYYKYFLRWGFHDMNEHTLENYHQPVPTTPMPMVAGGGDLSKYHSGGGRRKMVSQRFFMLLPRSKSDHSKQGGGVGDDHHS